MGEEAKQEEVKAETKPEEKQEEKKEEEKKEEEKPAEEKKEEEPPKPPSPVVLFVDLHCVGCAKKIERSLMRYRGVEGIVIDMEQNQITVKGVVDPQALCTTIQKKTKRRASVLSPLPPAEGEATPQFVPSQVSGLVTVELNVNMHCEACAQQLKRKILKMRGVQSAEADFITSKVTVTGTMDAQRLVDYVYRRTKKQARIVPQPEPEPEPEPEPKPEPEPEAKAEEKKEEGEKPPEEAPKEEAPKEENGEKKEEEKPPQEEEEKKEGKEEKVEESIKVEEINNEDRNDRMMYYYPPMYVIERIPPPQIFSDENPNACCIS